MHISPLEPGSRHGREGRAGFATLSILPWLFPMPGLDSEKRRTTRPSCCLDLLEAVAPSTAAAASGEAVGDRKYQDRITSLIY